MTNKLKRHPSGSVINSDLDAYKAHKKQKEIQRNKDQEIEELKQNISQLTSLVQELKKMMD